MPAEEPTIQQLFDLQGKVALITGGTGYLGSAMARALAEAGARVVISSRDPQRAAAAAAELPPVAAGEHLGVELDHMEEASLERGFHTAVERAQQVDVLVNNGHEPLANDWTTVTGEQFTRQLANATGYFLLARLLRNHLQQRQAESQPPVGGSIVLVGSMYGVVGSYPDAYADLCPASPVAYHALKGGLVQMTRHLAAYWAEDRVRVNCLSPGPFPHPQAPPELVERLAQKSPLRRMGQPHELKGAIVFLASEASSYLTGQNLIVDGGWTAW
ncbi:SDR family NAD(P)-dependent oxidoreductase [Candidatus Laterigemmans baculatus]|uniref:SDR family NAD(P)-dependent oxidoreductase n=1 Tax=Candidatus Laterigemmans baculatus TaxID=2770505 RepID=UPI0013DA44DA|nr:SDR family oxidoreductase [Candidatus Laterigemmans baculatus]